VTIMPSETYVCLSPLSETA